MVVLIITSFLAGILTILTPCSFTLLPAILGVTIAEKRTYKALITILSLAISVLIFSIVLKAGTNALIVDQNLLNIISGLIIVLVGIFIVFPEVWTKISIFFRLEVASAEFLNKGKNKGVIGAIFIGLALGPVFTSCSPMFGYILYAILPVSFFEGLIYLLSFVTGMSLFLILIAALGQKLVLKMKWLSNPNSRFKKFIGVIFIVLGVMILLKIDKQLESFLLEQPFIQNLLLNKIEQNVINSI